MTIQLINDSKKLNSLIGNIKKSSGTLSANVHNAAYNCIVLIENNSDVRPLNKLYSVLSPSGQKALRLWCGVFAKTSWNAKKAQFVVSKKAESNLPGAMEIGPFEYAKPKADRKPVTFDLKARTAKLVADALKAGFTTAQVKAAIV